MKFKYVLSHSYFSFLSTLQTSAQTTERPRPAEWNNPGFGGSPFPLKANAFSPLSQKKKYH